MERLRATEVLHGQDVMALVVVKHYKVNSNSKISSLLLQTCACRIYNHVLAELRQEHKENIPLQNQGIYRKAHGLVSVPKGA